jgi:pyruvate/2-oxoglutarate dehydrogenase complex dihydrolipoamide dehydrogenase (E3) component
VTNYDAIVIGTGQAGPYVTSRLAGAGMKVAVVERNLIGGTCVNTGCIPTKTMVASAYAARMAARAAEFGVDVGPFRVDMKRVKARKDSVSGQSRTGLEDWLRNMENCTVYQGHARFESAHDVRVGEDRLHADKIFLNVGGRAFVPDMPGIAEIDFLTNSSMMSVDFLPKLT